MIVVADTSPLNYLILIERIDILPALYGEVLIPQAVLRELLSVDAPAPVRLWAEDPPAWLSTKEVAIVSFEGALDVDPGEREAIQLAIDHGRAQILIDERVGRLLTARHSLDVTGTIGILEDAEDAGLLDSRKPSINSCEQRTARLRLC
jgi:predicted nucleic acid-binding protein